MAFFLCERRRTADPSAMREQLKKMILLIAELDCVHRPRRLE
jgi:hypothetical protein